MRIWRRAFLFFATLSLSLSGRELAWLSPLFQDNRESDGSTLDESWSFYLGYFSGPFVPTSSNTEQWCQNWVTLDVASYSTFAQRFAGSWTDTGEVPNGELGYIWGLNRGAEQPEWILMNSSSWSFPLPPENPLDPSQRLTWLTTEAENVVVGSVGSSGVHLMTAAVTGAPNLLTGEQWQQLNFTPSELDDSVLSDWDSDPDRDGLSNLEEFAFGTNPRAAGSLDLSLSLQSGFLEFTVPRGEKVSVVYTAQVGDNLSDWDEGSPFVSLQAETSTSLTYRDLTAIAAGSGRRFGRVRVALAP